MITTAVKRIAILLTVGSVVAYAGFNWWWSEQTEELEAALRPVKALERFDTSNAIVPADRILAGGPPPDGIPSIDRPKFVSVGAVDFLKETDEVLLYTHGDQSRVYPFRILVWHEVVNDEIGDQSIAVTYCPLCGTAMVFDRTLNGETLEFGVSGLLYNSDVLFFDRQTDSLWTQLGRECVSGRYAGEKLPWLVSEQMTWAAAKAGFSHALVLSLDTGFEKHYDSEAYVEYKNSPKNSFPVKFSRDEIERKAWVLGVEIEGKAKAYPIVQLAEARQLNDEIAQVKIRVTYDPDTRSAIVTNRDSHEPVPSVRSYWFAWQAFYPGTELWSVGK